MDQFTLQCAEDKVFLGRKETPRPPGSSGPVQSANRINLKDQRRKILDVRAVAASRFAAQFNTTPGASERRSQPIVVDVPSTVRMTPPDISHVVPLRRNIIEGGRSAGKSITTFGMRIYVRRPWFQSTPVQVSFLRIGWWIWRRIAGGLYS
jgi:hypothetical protein